MLQKFWIKWIAFGEWLGDIIGGTILIIFYFTFFSIPGIFFSFISNRNSKSYSDYSYFTDIETDFVKEYISEYRDM